ncbi:cob(I)yrinic acid a,c-diamide adenosyltransferase [Hydromonas duriensis]|uniref:Cobalamin adenosyltransferase n=1 Tax=Hydromonas duriensis TaxID=1527608 RepID=A0A4R6Y5Z1_9BURK|nr:cob(I)yrinic acid a,c-diamide adenosyltransferase [Hydromonas duriensis]TDR29063.1 cob(I)alamin adenosyltransferase [Hydromonas duriensis]
MNRIDQIITRTGDNGTTALADGTRHLKSSPRFMTMGDVDELNSHIGLLRSHLRIDENTDNDSKINELDHFLTDIQHHLFEIGSELAVPGMSFLNSKALDMLETWSAKETANLPALKEFILPSGTIGASQAHVCRSVARRAERSMVDLAQVEAVNDLLVRYLNRCSDVFFIMARVLNQYAQHPETHWRGNLNE